MYIYAKMRFHYAAKCVRIQHTETVYLIPFDLCRAPNEPKNPFFEVHTVYLLQKHCGRQEDAVLVSLSN